MYSSKLKPLYTAFLNSINVSQYRIKKKNDKDPLAVEQNSYLTKILNVQIVYDLDAWPKNSNNNFKFKNYLFKATNIVKNNDKKACIQWIWVAFDSASSQSFDNDFA